MEKSVFRNIFSIKLAKDPSEELKSVSKFAMGYFLGRQIFYTYLYLKDIDVVNELGYSTVNGIMYHISFSYL